MDQAGVTHVLPMLEVLAAFAQAACQRMQRPALWAVTFQGYEVYGYTARLVGLEKAFLDVLRRTTESSPLPPITVSRWYAARIEREIGIPADRFLIIPPGIPLPRQVAESRAREIVQDALGVTDFASPIVSFVENPYAAQGASMTFLGVA